MRHDGCLRNRGKVRLATSALRAVFARRSRAALDNRTTMFKQLRHAMAPQKWLRTWDPREKHTLLCFRIAETIDDAKTQGMEIDDAWLVITKGGVGLTLAPGMRNDNDLLASVKLSDNQSFVEAHRLLKKEHEMSDTTSVTDAVEKAVDELTDEVLRQIYGSEYLKKLARTT